MSGAVRIVLGATAAVVLALLAAEVTMQPSSHDRVVLIGVFASVAVLVAGAAGVLGRLTQRLTSLHTAVLVTSIAAVAAAAAAILASAASMFLSGHDLRLVLIALGLGVALGVVLAASVTRPLEADLLAIRQTAGRVAAGDRDVRTGVVRADEVGDLARALDDMIGRLAEAEAERSRMEDARREFLASVGHDLRTPLTSLRGAIEAIEDGLVEDPSRYLAAMRSDVRLLSSLVDDLFLLSRIESGALHLEREPVDLTELADEAVEAMRHVGRARGVTIDLDADADAALPVAVSTPEIGRVLRNLLDNAVRHTPDGGRVLVRTRRDGDRAVIEVVDEGPGFPPDFVGRAFESFARADGARQRDGSGAGLGLAIARGLVDAHGGTVTARPGPPGHVTVTLPLRTADVRAAGARPPGVRA